MRTIAARRLPSGEALAGFRRGFRARKFRDQVFERSPCYRNIAEFDLATRDVEHRVGDFLAVRIRGEQLPLRRDRGAEILERILGVAGPVHRRWRQGTLRIGACERLEARYRCGVVAALEQIEGGVVAALLTGDIGRHRRGTRCDHPRRDAAWGAARPSVGARRRCIRGWRARAGGALEPAQAPIEIEIEIALALLRLLELVGQYFVLTAELGDIRLDVFDVVEEVHQSLALDRGLERGDALAERGFELV